LAGAAGRRGIIRPLGRCFAIAGLFHRGRNISLGYRATTSFLVDRDRHAIRHRDFDTDRHRHFHADRHSHFDRHFDGNVDFLDDRPRSFAAAGFDRRGRRQVLGFAPTAFFTAAVGFSAVAAEAIAAPIVAMTDEFTAAAAVPAMAFEFPAAVAVVPVMMADKITARAAITTATTVTFPG
jgi:hypothetical protein